MYAYIYLKYIYLLLKDMYVEVKSKWMETYKFNLDIKLMLKVTFIAKFIIKTYFDFKNYLDYFLPK